MDYKFACFFDKKKIDSEVSNSLVGVQVFLLYLEHMAVKGAIKKKLLLLQSCQILGKTLFCDKWFKSNKNDYENDREDRNHYSPVKDHP